MTNRQQIQEIPGALRLTFERARADYGTVIRKVRWGDGPVLICGAGDCGGLSQAASYAFETFPGWPVVARPVEVFQTYALGLLKQRSVLIMIAAAGEWPEVQELAATAKQRGVVVVVLTSSPESPLVKLADHVLLTRSEGATDSPAVTLCLHAALNFLAFEAARILKRPEPQWGQVNEEFDQLPEKIEWLFTQLPAVVRSFAAELARLPRLRIVGGGFYQFPCWRAARQLQSLPSSQVAAVEASEFLSSHAQFAPAGDAVLITSGSHSKIKKLLHRCAEQAKANGARVLSLTDGNDRALVEGSDLGILIPPLLEAPASTLAMFVLEWIAWEVRCAGKG
jgi:DNA-binding MurR/RpiR family transcriptional regulator